MATNIVNLGNAKVDAKLLAEYTREVMQHLQDEYKAKEAAKAAAALAKETVNTFAETSGLDEKLLMNYMKARFADQMFAEEEEDSKRGTAATIEMGQMFDSLNGLLEGEAL